MRKVIFLCVLMMTLLPLSGCGEGQKALDEALTVRTEYLALTNFSTRAQIRADYGQRVYDFTLDVSARDDEMTLTVVEPELIAGITARLGKDSAALEYDGVSMETGPLTPEGLTPMSAVPTLLEVIRGTYITACSYEEDGALRVTCGDPDAPVGTGVEYLLFFHPDTHDLTRAEISLDGARRLQCTFSPFTKE